MAVDSSGNNIITTDDTEQKLSDIIPKLIQAFWD